MSLVQNTIVGRNLSDAWAKALVRCHTVTGGVLAPAIVEFPAPASGQSIEDEDVRRLVEAHLHSLDHPERIETVAGTIFPYSIWKWARGDRAKFFGTYIKGIERVLRCHGNCNGVYFARMVAFPDESGNTINQLEQVISTWKGGNHRHSALQAAVFNPFKDLTDQRQRGFPCLQQLAFYPEGTNGVNGLSVVAFYANQNLIEKGYGNYLGLYRLGEFMAHEMGLRLSKVVCVASALKLGKESKTKSNQLFNDIKALVSDATA